MQDPECMYYSDSEDGNVLKGYCVFLTHIDFLVHQFLSIIIFIADCIVQDGLDGQNNELNLALKKQKKKLKKLLDKVKPSLDLSILFAGYVVLGLGL
jgi:nucleolar complex protein 2